MRKKARELALQILFQMEFAPQISYESFMEVFEQQFNKESIDYADHLISGIIKNKTAIDEKIQKSCGHWKLDRMTLIDKNILRIAAFEMKWDANPLQDKIAINEAIELAKKYGTTESGSFVNGVLDQLARTT